MLQFRSQGQILGPDGQRMSKSRGNVVDPDKQVKKYGADTVRAFLCFGYRWQDGGPWDDGNIQGSYRWLGRVWTAFLEAGKKGNRTEEIEKNLRRKLHQTLRNVTRDFEQFEFNTIISALMELINDMIAFKDAGGWNTDAWHEAVDMYLCMMAPITPHIAEELWAQLGKPYSIHQQDWPQVNEEATVEEKFVLVVQVNGKLRDKVNVPVGISEEKAKETALASENVQKYLADKKPRKVIYVPGRLVNIVI